MKVNLFMLFIALVLAVLVFIGFNHYYGELLYSLGAALGTLIILATGMAFSPREYPRSGVMMKVVSWIFFFILLGMDILFAVYSASDTLFLIVNIAVLCIWAVSVYSINKAKQ